MVWSHRVPRLLAAVVGSLALAVPLAGAGTAAAAASRGLAKPAASSASSPDSPVDLATPIDFAGAIAARGATVTAGDARFEVLGDGLIRMEYSPTGNFEDLPTVNVLNRRFPVPDYRADVSNGWLTITTSEATLLYRLGSGPFGPSNVSVSFRDAGQPATVSPVWPNECPYGQVCDAGAAALSGPANIQTNHANYQSVAGFIAGLGQGNQAGATWTVLGAPAGQAQVTLRYSNYLGALGGPAPRTIDLVVNGTDTGPLTLPPTASWDDWATVTADVPLTAGTNTVGVVCAATDSCNVNVDTLSVSAAGSAAPAEPDVDYLGGYTTERGDGPGDATGTTVTLSAPSGWTVIPSTAASAGTIAPGSSATQSWTVQAPAGSSTSPQTASLQAQASYTSAGLREQVSAAQQAPPAAAPPPTPVLSAVSPATTTAGSPVTLTGQNFGSSQGSSYLTLAQGGTSWGAPYDGAKLTITSWSDTSIAFTLPPDSGPYPLEPGTATITVTVDGQSSAAQTITITS